MSKKKLTADPTAPYDAGRGICPLCLSSITVYVPPDRSVGGAQAYPALMLHYEQAHPAATPPPPPVLVKADGKDAADVSGSDEWDTPPPAPEKWVPFDVSRAAKGLPQPAGVWPPAQVQLAE